MHPPKSREPAFPRTAIDPDVPLIVLPAYPEDYDPIGFCETVHDVTIAITVVIGDEGNDVARDLVHGLVEFEFTGISADEPSHEMFDCLVQLPVCHFASPIPWKVFETT